MKDGKLEVGDVVYATYRERSIEGRHVIDRVTRTLAISGTHKFKIDIRHSGGVDLLGREIWSSTYYYIATPELDEKYLRWQLSKEVEAVVFSTLPIEKLKQILEIVKT